MEAIFSAYKEDRRKEGKSVQKLGWNWNALGPVFGAMKPADLAEANIEVAGEMRTLCHKYAADMFAKGLARDTIWDRLSCLRTAVNWAFRRGMIAARPYIWVPQKGRPRDIVAEEAEVLRILEECRADHVRLFVLIASATGARKTAILQLTWGQVDFERRIIDFRDRRKKGILDKSGQKGRAAVEFGLVLELALREARETARSDYVIEYAGGPVADVKKGLAAAVARAKLTHRKIGAHVLRHSVATWLADENVDMRKIQKMLGHSNVKTTEQVYCKYRRGYLSEAATVIDLKLAGARK